MIDPSGNAIASMREPRPRQPVVAHQCQTLAQSGELRSRVDQAYDRLSACDLCPRACGVDRLRGQRGYCGADADLVLGSWAVHQWEEPPISGDRGSGTIFFSHCTARCLFCQNYPISQLGVGKKLPVERLAEIMLLLQHRGCHNINLVTPTHYVPHILDAVDQAVRLGLTIPILYNTSGYESVETLQLLDGVVDIYLPDAKYADDSVAREISGYDDYVRHNRAALLEMQQQVPGGLLLGDDGIAQKGIIVRHLVLPGKLSQTAQVLEWVAKCMGPGTFVSLMAQYFPAHLAVDDARLGRRLTAAEYASAVALLDRYGLENGWQQELDTVY